MTSTDILFNRTFDTTAVALMAAWCAYVVITASYRSAVRYGRWRRSRRRRGKRSAWQILGLDGALRWRSRSEAEILFPEDCVDSAGHRQTVYH